MTRRAPGHGTPLLFALAPFCALAGACGGSSATSTETTPQAATASGAEEVATPTAAEPVQTWWSEDVPVEDPQGLEASAKAQGLRDGVTITLGGTALFADRFPMTDLFAPDHPMHRHMPEPDVQWRFALARGPVEVVMTVPAEAAADWLQPPSFVLHQQGRRWPSVVAIAPGRTASEVRGTVDIDGESRRPVILAPGGATVPVLFLRCREARVDVSVDGGPVASAEHLEMHVMPLLDALEAGEHTVTLVSTARPREEAQEEEEQESGDEESGEGETPPAPPPPLAVEALLVVGETVRPARVVLGAEPTTTTLPFQVP